MEAGYDGGSTMTKMAIALPRKADQFFLTGENVYPLQTTAAMLERASPGRKTPLTFFPIDALGESIETWPPPN